MVLAPSRRDWKRAQRLLADDSTGVYDDLGEQSVWRRLYERVHALPAGYAALRCSDLPADDWASQVRVLHDPNLLRKASRAGFKQANVVERLKSFDERAGKLNAQLAPILTEAAAQRKAEAAAARKKGAGGGGRRARKGRRGR